VSLSSGRRSNGRAGAVPRLAQEGLDDKDPLFVVAYADDDPHLFWNGTRMKFGRDDKICQIPIWEQINERALSKVAGELWCSGGQMWVRNLSTAHELVVGDSTGVRVLPSRVGADAGHACSVPSPSGTVTAPSTGTWSLTVQSWSLTVQTAQSQKDAGPTLRVENIPDRHRAAAEALCAPLLAGGTAAATYAEIADRMGWTERAARRRVEELCEHYRAQVKALPGGHRPGETLPQAVARTLVARNKFAVPRGTGPPPQPGGGARDRAG